jgi:hypothetical protein
MTMHVNPSAVHPRGRSFGTLSAGMVLRGAVSEQVLCGPACAVPPQTQALRDTPWTDPAPVLTPAPNPEPVPAPKPKSAPPAAKPGKQRRALTVRLDDVQHLRLRLVTAYLESSAQDLFVTALDAYLDQLPSTIPGNCACLKARMGPGSR